MIFHEQKRISIYELCCYCMANSSCKTWRLMKSKRRYSDSNLEKRKHPELGHLQCLLPQWFLECDLSDTDFDDKSLETLQTYFSADLTAHKGGIWRHVLFFFQVELLFFLFRWNHSSVLCCSSTPLQQLTSFSPL